MIIRKELPAHVRAGGEDLQFGVELDTEVGIEEVVARCARPDLARAAYSVACRVCPPSSRHALPKCLNTETERPPRLNRGHVVLALLPRRRPNRDRHPTRQWCRVRAPRSGRRRII